MTISINSIALSNVAEFFQNNGKIMIKFQPNHHHKSILTIKQRLDEMGLNLGSFFFKGVSSYEYCPHSLSPMIAEEPEGRTEVVCHIPEELKDKVYILIAE